MGRKLMVAVVLLSAAWLGGSFVGPSDASRHATGPSFSGDGGKDLAPFRVSVPSTLYWSASGGIFQLFSDGTAGGNVNSSAASGWSYLQPGRYQFTVNAIGRWRISVRRGIVAPRVAGAGLVGYAGAGGMELPPVTLRSSGTLSWRASGGLFQMFDDSFIGGANVNSSGTRGTTYVKSGKHRWTVNALGKWTITWRR